MAYPSSGREQEPHQRGTRLSPEGAEALIDRVRRRFGLGQAFHLEVHANERGDWEIEDGRGEHMVAAPMGARRLKQWFYERYGDVIVERRQSLEG